MGRDKEQIADSGSARRIPLVSWVLLLAVVLSLLVGGVVAYLSASTKSVTNSFTSDVSKEPVVTEQPFNGKIKKNVTVNVGNPDYAVYVRAAVVITWKNSQGHVLGTLPVAGEEEDYAIAYNTTDWFYNNTDGFWYYKEMVTPTKNAQNEVQNNTTKALINSCEIKKAAPDGDYTLSVEIISQTIQALGTTDVGDIPAVTNAWGIEVDPATKELIIPTP